MQMFPQIPKQEALLIVLDGAAKKLEANQCLFTVV